MLEKILFITGSSDEDVLELAAADFLNHARSYSQHIVIIADQDHDPSSYTAVMKKHNICNFSVVQPDITDLKSLQNTVKLLKSASGIILDKTDLLEASCLVHPLKGLITELYNAGVPVMGCAEQSFLLQKKNTSKTGSFMPGHTLGLIDDHIIMQKKSPSSDHLIDEMNRLGAHHGVEIESQACAVFVNGRLSKAHGEGVYHIEAHPRKKAHYSYRSK